jgi:hypothetical protein
MMTEKKIADAELSAVYHATHGNGKELAWVLHFHGNKVGPMGVTIAETVERFRDREFREYLKERGLG